MEKQTKTILTIVGVVAAVVIGYKILSPKEEEEKSGFWGWNPKKKRVTLDAPSGTTIQGYWQTDGVGNNQRCVWYNKRNGKATSTYYNSPCNSVQANMPLIR